MVMVGVKKPLLISISLFTLSLLLAVIWFTPSNPFSESLLSSTSSMSEMRGEKTDIWSVRRIVEWRPCKWWLNGDLSDNLHLVFCVEMLQLFRQRVVGIFDWIAMVGLIR